MLHGRIRGVCHACKLKSDTYMNACVCMQNRVETGLSHPGYPGQLGQVLSGSTGSDLVYKLSGSNPDCTLDNIH